MNSNSSNTWITLDETEDAFILTNELYNNTSIIYQLHGPHKMHIPIQNRVMLWKWNIKTKERTTIPTCEYPIYGATIISNQLIVLVDHHGFDFYELDLSDEYSQWSQVSTLAHYCWKIHEEDRLCLPTLHKFGDAMFLKFVKKMHYYNPETGEYEMHEIPKKHRKFSQIAKVNNKCYCLLQEENRFVQYNVDKKTWNQCSPNASDDTPMMQFGKHQLITTLKVYRDRFILVHYHYEQPSPSWEFLVYDTKMDEWSGLGEWSRSVEHSQEVVTNGIWLGDHFIYYRSFLTLEPVIATLVNRVWINTTSIFDISHFVENWYIISPILLMRKLILNGRAEVKEDQVSVLLYKIIVDIDDMILHRILYFLIVSPQSD